MALGLLTGALTGAVKSLGGKKKKSGSKMASAIVKREPQEDAIAKEQPKIKVKTKTVSVSSLMDTKSLESQSRKQSTKSSGVDSIDAALDNIDNTLNGLIVTIKSSSQFQKNEIRRKNRRRIQGGKREREEELEKKGSVPKFGMRIPRPFRSAFDAIQNFFSNIIIGSLVIMLLENIEGIIDSLKKVYETMKTVVTKVGEFLQPVWKVLKWIWPGNSPSGLEMVRSILANKNTQDLMDLNKINEIKEESEKVREETKRLEGLFQNIENDVNIEPEEDIETAMNDVPPPPPLIQQERYTIPTLVPLLKSVGATDEEAVRLAAIGMHESSGDPKARNRKWPDDSYGLFQVNMLDEPGYKLGEERREKYGISNNDLLDPQTNARVALDILRTQGREAWSTDSMVTPDQLKRGRESLKLKPSTLKMGDQSSIRNKINQVSSLMTTPSYASSGNTTIIAMGGDNQSTVVQGGGKSSPVLLPILPSSRDVMLNNYEFRVQSSLWKVG